MSLMKRSKEGELVILNTDKSNKLAVTTLEIYEEMGQVHTSKDREVEEEEVRQVQRTLNGHMSMTLKFLKAGNSWNHQDRIRSTTINHSEAVSPMYLLVKDHKGAKNGVLPTRPVVSGCANMGVHLSNILADIVESLANGMTDSPEMLNSEDMSARADIHNEQANLQKLREEIAADMNIPVEQVRMAEELILVGSDGVQLFPNLEVEETVSLIREELMESEVTFDDIDNDELLKYLAMNCTEEQVEMEGLTDIVPSRKYVYGRRPGITSEEALAPKQETDEKSKWTFTGKREPTKQEQKKALSLALSIAIRASFQNYVYTFGGKRFIQLFGGPIGSRLTMACARIVMGRWGKRVRQLLSDSNVRLLLEGIYVDDARHLLRVQHTDWIWSKQEMKFITDENAKRNSDIKCRRDHTVRQIKLMMNSILKNIRFTVELEQDFENGYLATLDMEFRILECGTLDYRFYEKPMSSETTIPEGAAISESQKRAILVNEIARRLLNIRESDDQDRVNKTIDIYVDKLRRSGYKDTKIIDIVKGGIVLHERRVEDAKREGRNVHRLSKDTTEARFMKKLTGKENWFRKRKNIKQVSELSSRVVRRQSPAGTDGRKELEYTGLMFVVMTRGSKLIKSLKEIDDSLSQVTGNKTRFVERAGRQLGELLTKADPWEGGPCHKKNCKVCPGEGVGKCGIRNIIYKNSCIECREKGKRSEYIGESARCMRERRAEHEDDREDRPDKSHMRLHELQEHEGRTVEFQMSLVKRAKSSMERQVGECIRIRLANKREVEVLNLKDEYNRCLLPELSVKEQLKSAEEEGEQESKRKNGNLNTIQSKKIKRFHNDISKRKINTEEEHAVLTEEVPTFRGLKKWKGQVNNPDVDPIPTTPTPPRHEDPCATPLTGQAPPAPPTPAPPPLPLHITAKTSVTESVDTIGVQEEVQDQGHGSQGDYKGLISIAPMISNLELPINLNNSDSNTDSNIHQQDNFTPTDLKDLSSANIKANLTANDNFEAILEANFEANEPANNLSYTHTDNKQVQVQVTNQAKYTPLEGDIEAKDKLINKFPPLKFESEVVTASNTPSLSGTDGQNSLELEMGDMTSRVDMTVADKSVKSRESSTVEYGTSTESNFISSRTGVNKVTDSLGELVDLGDLEGLEEETELEQIDTEVEREVEESKVESEEKVRSNEGNRSNKKNYEKSKKNTKQCKTPKKTIKSKTTNIKTKQKTQNFKNNLLNYITRTPKLDLPANQAFDGRNPNESPSPHSATVNGPIGSQESMSRDPIRTVIGQEKVDGRLELDGHKYNAKNDKLMLQVSTKTEPDILSTKNLTKSKLTEKKIAKNEAQIDAKFSSSRTSSKYKQQRSENKSKLEKAINKGQISIKNYTFKRENLEQKLGSEQKSSACFSVIGVEKSLGNCQKSDKTIPTPKPQCSLMIDIDKTHNLLKKDQRNSEVSHNQKVNFEEHN